MTKKILTILGIFFGILIVLFGLLNKRDQDVNAIIISDNILKNFYLANRNLEDPVFIRYNDLSEIQIALIRDDYIKREVLKREALNWGFYNDILEPDEILKTVIDQAKRLAQGPTFAHAMTKKSLHQEWNMGIEEFIEAEAQAQAICMQTQDFARAYHAFVAKEKPVFEGN